MSVLSLQRVSKGFATPAGRLEVLRDADLEIRPGDFCVLNGPSGSGKSTLLHIMGCLDAPDSGAVEMDGQDITKLSDRRAAELRNARIGFIFQAFHLIPVLTAVENVAYPLVVQGVPARQRIDRAREILVQVGLESMTRQRPSRLSGGQCQRVAIARSLVTRPQLVLADEPTASLDRKTARDILGLLKTLSEEEHVTLFIVTHDPLISEYATRHFVLDSCKIIEKTGSSGGAADA